MPMPRRDTPSPVVNAETLRAYLGTTYVVDVPAMPGARARRVTLRIGRQSRAVLALHAALGVDSSVFVTAWNPFSGAAGDAENARAMARLLAMLVRQGYRPLTGRGVGEDPAWTPEESLFVPGADAAFARAACVRYRQSAAVHVGGDGVPRLILHPRIAIG